MTACLNCRSELVGPFCHVCGQKDEPRLQTFRQLASDAFTEAFSLDGKLWRTLHQLFTKPGFATTEYLAGRRTRQVHPFRLYLIVSVFYFLVLTVTGFDTFFFVGTSPQSLAARHLRLLPKLMFVILPAVAFLLKGLYRRHLYVEHWVTALHLHVVMFVLLSIHTVLMNAYPVLPGPLRLPLYILIDVPAQLTVFVYLFLTLRRVYGQSRLVTAAKVVALALGYVFVLGALGIAIVALGNAIK